MKKLKKHLTKILIMCLAVCFFALSACDCAKEASGSEYYIYDSVELELDIEIPEASVFKDDAEMMEDALKGAFSNMKTVYNELYAENIVKLSEESLIWYMKDSKAEYKLAKSSGEKINVSEVDVEIVKGIEEFLAEQSATIKDGIKFYVEKEKDSINLCVEVLAMQAIFDGVYMNVDYDFEYKFTKTNERPANEDDETPIATYNFKNVALTVGVTALNGEQLDLIETFEEDTKTTISSQMQGDIQTYNTNYANTKLSAFEERVVWHNSGIMTTYGFVDQTEDINFLDSLSTGTLNYIKEKHKIEKVIDSKLDVKSTTSYFVESENACQIVLKIVGETTISREEGNVKIKVEYEYAFNFEK